MFINDQNLTDQSYSNKPSHERVILISSISNRNLNTLKNSDNRGLNLQTRNVQNDRSLIHLTNKLRCGGDNLPENFDQNLEKTNESLKESVKLDQLEKNLASKSVKDSKSFTDTSFNKIVLRIVDKMEPIIANPKFLRILSETQKPVKPEFSISVQSSSKNIINSKLEKNSAKKGSSIFVEALAPINPRRWPAFTAGSAMTSDMPDFRDKLQTPLENLRVAKEYLETAQSDLQWRARLWQVAEDTTTINI